MFAATHSAAEPHGLTYPAAGFPFPPSGSSALLRPPARPSLSLMVNTGSEISDAPLPAAPRLTLASLSLPAPQVADTTPDADPAEKQALDPPLTARQVLTCPTHPDWPLFVTLPLPSWTLQPRHSVLDLAAFLRGAPLPVTHSWNLPGMVERYFDALDAGDLEPDAAVSPPAEAMLPFTACDVARHLLPRLRASLPMIGAPGVEATRLSDRLAALRWVYGAPSMGLGEWTTVERFLPTLAEYVKERVKALEFVRLAEVLEADEVCLARMNGQPVGSSAVRRPDILKRVRWTSSVRST